MTSTRKPYNNCAGYIASLRSGAGRGWVVIYLTAEQKMDGSKYMVSCEAHSCFVTVSSMPLARTAMKSPENFCQQCREAAGVA
jgi:hypothetical protein